MKSKPISLIFVDWLKVRWWKLSFYLGFTLSPLQRFKKRHHLCAQKWFSRQKWFGRLFEFEIGRILYVLKLKWLSDLNEIWVSKSLNANCTFSAIYILVQQCHKLWIQVLFFTTLSQTLMDCWLRHPERKISFACLHPGSKSLYPDSIINGENDFNVYWWLSRKSWQWET